MYRYRTFIRLAVLALWACTAQTYAQIWRCEGAHGVAEYTNAPAEPRERNCRQITSAPITTIPAPALPRSAAPRDGRSTTVSPPGYPRIDVASQKARDSDRRRILDDELRSEGARQSELRGEYERAERAEPRSPERLRTLKEALARSGANVDALRRELAAIKDAP